MKKGRFAEEQIAFALRQAETGTPVAEVIRNRGSRSRPFIAGRSSTPGWAWPSCGG